MSGPHTDQWLIRLHHPHSGAHRLSVRYTPPAGHYPPELSIWRGNPRHTPPITLTPEEARQLAAALIEGANLHHAAIAAAVNRITGP